MASPDESKAKTPTAVVAAAAVVESSSSNALADKKDKSPSALAEVFARAASWSKSGNSNGGGSSSGSGSGVSGGGKGRGGRGQEKRYYKEGGGEVSNHAPAAAAVTALADDQVRHAMFLMFFSPLFFCVRKIRSTCISADCVNFFRRYVHLKGQQRGWKGVAGSVFS